MSTAIRSVAISVSVALVVAAVYAATLALSILDEAILSEHAKTAHLGQKLHAEVIRDNIRNGRCLDLKVYDCGLKAYVLCLDTPPAYYGGLVIGFAKVKPVIITGFGADVSYWSKKVRDCRETSLDTFKPSW